MNKKIPIKIESQENILDGKILLENINIDILNKLINSKDEDGLLKTYDKIEKNEIYSNEFLKNTYSTEREQLIKYRDKIKFNKSFVRYDKVKKLNGFGRVFPYGSLGLFSFRKEIRGALANDYYYDIDISNAHPVLLLQICINNDIECKYLSKYVKDRNKYLKMIIDEYNVNRNQAKELFIILLYFGSFKRWAEINDIKKEEIKFITKFKKELKNIGEIISKHNDELKGYIENKLKDNPKKKKNLVGTIISFVLQEWEYRIIESIYIYCKEKGIINNDAVICADGIMICKDKYNDNLLIEFKDLIYNKIGFELEFVKKDLNLDIYNKLI